MKLLITWRFLRLAISNGLLSVALFSFLSVSPFLLIHQLRLSPALAGLCLLWVALFAIAGTLLHRVRSVSRHAAVIGRSIALLGGLASVASAYLLPMSTPSLIAPICLVTLGSGLSGPSFLASAITADRDAIGTASSVFGATQMALSAAGTTLVAVLAVGDQQTLSLIILGSVAVAFLMMPRRGRAPGK